MFTKKDREIANLKAMVANRNMLIKDQSERLIGLSTKLSQINVIASSNVCGNPEVYLRKIKELADLRNQTSSI